MFGFLKMLTECIKSADWATPRCVKQLSLAIILMYDHLEFELLLLMRNSFHAFTNINVKEGGQFSGSAKKGGGLLSW